MEARPIRRRSAATRRPVSEGRRREMAHMAHLKRGTKGTPKKGADPMEGGTPCKITELGGVQMSKRTEKYGHKLQNVKVRVKGAEQGLVEAVFSTFNMIDSDGDVTLPGAFRGRRPGPCIRVRPARP